MSPLTRTVSPQAPSDAAVATYNLTQVNGAHEAGVNLRSMGDGRGANNGLDHRAPGFKLILFRAGNT